MLEVFLKEEMVLLLQHLLIKHGLKGYQVGGAQISTKHAGFIVNTKNGTAEDVLKIVEHVKKVIKKEFEKEIELEIIVIGED